MLLYLFSPSFFLFFFFNLFDFFHFFSFFIVMCVPRYKWQLDGVSKLLDTTREHLEAAEARYRAVLTADHASPKEGGSDVKSGLLSLFGFDSPRQSPRGTNKAINNAHTASATTAAGHPATAARVQQLEASNRALQELVQHLQAQDHLHVVREQSLEVATKKQQELADGEHHAATHLRVRFYLLKKSTPATVCLSGAARIISLGLCLLCFCSRYAYILCFN